LRWAQIFVAAGKPGFDWGGAKVIVMAGLVPAIHVLFLGKDVDARHEAGHDK
jgi:hypothetical protein